MKNKSYAREFKLEVLELLNSDRTRSQQELGRELGIGKGNISRWKRMFTEEGEQAFPGKGHQMADEERRREAEILEEEEEDLESDFDDDTEDNESDNNDGEEYM